MSLAGSIFARPEFSAWPAGTAPAEVGRRLAENWAARPLEYTVKETRKWVIYPEVITWYGSLDVTRLTGESALHERLVRKFDVLLTPEGAAHIRPRAHVDDRVFGVVPLTLHLHTGEPRYRELGLFYADQQWVDPTADGVTREARYWIDDMYMVGALQAQAFRVTRDPVYLDRAAVAMVAYLDKLQQPNGLFFHAPDSPFFWSRGCGWMAAGSAEILRELPADHPQRARILAGNRLMMEELLKLQGADGLWHQLLDHPESWSETSGTGMFAFAFVTGVTGGWLEAERYAPAARRAWLGLVAKLDADANVADVCIGTNKGKTVQYYLDRQRVHGDLHGQGPMLWTAAALLRDAKR